MQWAQGQALWNAFPCLSFWEQEQKITGCHKAISTWPGPCPFSCKKPKMNESTENWIKCLFMFAPKCLKKTRRRGGSEMQQQCRETNLDMWEELLCRQVRLGSVQGWGKIHEALHGSRSPRGVHYTEKFSIPYHVLYSNYNWCNANLI